MQNIKVSFNYMKKLEDMRKMGVGVAWSLMSEPNG